jgi:glutathione S-transferase
MPTTLCINHGPPVRALTMDAPPMAPPASAKLVACVDDELPPALSPSAAFRVFVIPFSHYCERARWALDYAGVPFATTCYLPLFHVAPLRSMRAGAFKSPRPRDALSSPASTPLLGAFAAGSGAPLAAWHDSGAVLRFADAALAQRGVAADSGLYPPAHAAVIAALEAGCHDRLGPDARIVAYGFLLPRSAAMVAVGTTNARADVLAAVAAASGGGGGVTMPWRRSQAALWWALNPLIRFLMRHAFKTAAPGRLDRARARVAAFFDEVSRALEANAAAQGVPAERAYLVGRAFTAADLTFASLAAPVLGVGLADGYGAWMPSPADMGPEAEALVAALRATPAGAHALRMYAQHRARRRG